jgi:hypothetical protein
MRRVLPVSVALAAACSEPLVDPPVYADSTDGECGMLSCDDELQISLVALGGVFTGGDYDVAVSVDDDVTSCGFVLSGDSSDCGGDPPCVLVNDCAADFGFAVRPHFVLLRVQPAADVVQIGIARDEASLLEETLAPDYQDYWPNGSDCAPMCRIASASIDVP